MGVGVYQSDFNGTGHTFLVSGPLPTEAEYDEHVKEVGPEDEEVAGADFPTWAQDQYDQANEELVVAVEQACRELGFGIEPRKGFRASRAAFDSEFVAIAHGGVVSVGWRSWETDFVVAVGPSRSAEERLGYEIDHALRELGRDPESYRQDYDAHSSAIEEFIRLSLMSNAGLECRFKTSGYTSALYVMPEGVANRLAVLKEQIRAGADKLLADPSDALGQIDAKERAKIISTAVDERMIVVFPVAEVKGDERRLHLYAVSDDFEDGFGVVASMAVPNELHTHVRLLDDGVTSIPRSSLTEGWFNAYQQSIRRADLVASADEISRALGEEVAIRFYDPIDNSVETIVVATAPESATPPAA
ncbi:hypothetical protein ACVIGB_000004 [Bradyrhizobium sp. USDA 4341]